jgi:hypothetical protein
MDKTGIINVNVVLERKIYASSADLYVEKKGTSSVSKSTPLIRAHEVQDLVAALSEVGIEESAIQVVGISTEIASGVITKSTSAVYRLLIEIHVLDKLVDAFGTITRMKNATLTLLGWHYTGLDEIHDEMLGQALQIAEQRAAIICRELRHRKQGVHNLKEEFKEQKEKENWTKVSYKPVLLKKLSTVKNEDLVLDVTHSKNVSMDVRVEYRVQPEPEAEPGSTADS